VRVLIFTFLNLLGGVLRLTVPAAKAGINGVALHGR